MLVHESPQSVLRYMNSRAGLRAKDRYVAHSHLAEKKLQGLVVPTVRGQVPGPSAMEGVMQHVRVISIADPSVLLPYGVVERGWQHVVVDTDDAQATLQQLQIVSIAFIYV